MLHIIFSWLQQQPQWLVWSLFWALQFTPALLAQVVLRDTEDKVYMWVACAVAAVGCGLMLPFLFAGVGWFAYFERP